MNKSEILADRLEEVIYDSPWYGQNINDILSKINATQALIRINNQHSIAEILQHMTVWKRFVYQKTFGDKEFDIRANDETDWKIIESLSEGEWGTMILEFMSITGELIQALGQLSAASYDKKVPGRDYTYDHMLFGIVDHDIYHIGQIALLSKLVTDEI